MTTLASDTVDVLHILAKDGGHLTNDDRARLALVAEEMDDLQRRLSATQGALLECNDRRMALKDALAALRSQYDRPPEMLRIDVSYGTMKINWP